MKLRFKPFQLKLTYPWIIASSLQKTSLEPTDTADVLFLELETSGGLLGRGEAPPAYRYGEDAQKAAEFLAKVNPHKLSVDDIDGSMAYLDTIQPSSRAARTALNAALWDAAAKRAGVPLWRHLGLGFTENKHVTSFSIGLDTPSQVREKIKNAATYPILKLKVGGPHDATNVQAIREIAPEKIIRIDANEAWKTKEDALRLIELLLAHGPLQFVEQPMPAETPPAELRWLKERSPVPLIADEAYHTARDLDLCLECFAGVNVKLLKTGGISQAVEALQAARKAGLKTMIGCMVESSLMITAAAHLAELADYIDLDGNLLIKNDPYQGVSSEKGKLSFATAPDRAGLCVAPRPQSA